MAQGESLRPMEMPEENCAFIAFFAAVAANAAADAGMLKRNRLNRCAVVVLNHCRAN
jgi:hypothetical protein